MGETTGIEWSDATWNPWVGCTRVSPGCDHCYMFAEQARRYIDGALVRRTAPTTFRLPLAHRRDGSWKVPSGARVFTCSYSDFFIPEADVWRADAWAIIEQRLDLHMLVLTKRPGRVLKSLPERGCPPNVWLGVSAEGGQHTWRARKLLELVSDLRSAGRTTPAVVWASVEPMLGPVDPADLAGLDWIVVGGESGDGARPFDVEWARALIAAGGPRVFVKQLGSNPWDGPRRRLELRDRKGGDPAEWPEDLRVRQYPEVKP